MKVTNCLAIAAAMTASAVTAFPTPNGDISTESLSESTVPPNEIQVQSRNPQNIYNKRDLGDFFFKVRKFPTVVYCLLARHHKKSKCIKFREEFCSRPNFLNKPVCEPFREGRPAHIESVDLPDHIIYNKRYVVEGQDYVDKDKDKKQCCHSETDEEREAFVARQRQGFLQDPRESEVSHLRKPS